MSKIDFLSKRAKPSLSHWVDKYSREEFGYMESEYSDIGIKKVIAKIIQLYENKKDERDYYMEIHTHLKDKEFVSDLYLMIKMFLENRPTSERVQHYKSLCTQYKLSVKENANKSKLEARIAAITSSGGLSQDI
ncbi:hypothetical protein BSK59_13390 [Paenibacillus odorifer]|uniref:hypothetical protein n=1 Tax=Paenibacillus odorifer TaxID=189426 RepID=UPI00096E96B3|nr:hypothetical protein [Paenibacillus odorifer]OME55466.1 hypothetical protein BSK59_13390 [Paenibacillus odorifer]